MLMLKPSQTADTRQRIVDHLLGVLRVTGRDMPATLWAEIDELARCCTLEVFRTGSALMLEDEPGTCLYVLLKGKVDVVKGYPAPDAVKIAERGPGDIVGEMNIDGQAGRFAGVIVRDTTEAIVVPYACLEDKAVGWRFLPAVNRKLREAQETRFHELQHYHRELAGLASLQDAFLGVIRHEMMTPVAKSVMAIDLLNRRIADQVNADTKRLLEILGISIGDTKRLVETLITYAALLNEQRTVRKNPAAFVDMTAAAIDRCRRRSKLNDVSLIANRKSIIRPVLVDVTLVTGAMEQLLDNALKYSPAGGSVLVTTWQEDRRVYFAVRDAGPGIKSEHLDMLWRPFEQEADNLKRHADGLGLGLALTRRIIRAHGGDVWVESQVGVGSEFGFWLPILSAAGLNNAT